MVTYVPHLLNLSVKAPILLVLFECKLLKFTFKAIFHINNAFTFKIRRAIFLVISEINSSH